MSSAVINLVSIANKSCCYKLAIQIGHDTVVHAHIPAIITKHAISMGTYVTTVPY